MDSNYPALDDESKDRVLNDVASLALGGHLRPLPARSYDSEAPEDTEAEMGPSGPWEGIGPSPEDTVPPGMGDI